MRNLAAIAAVTVALAAKPAEASRCGPDCLPWLTPVAAVMGIGIVGAYGYGIGYFAYHDLEGDERSTSYHGTELMLHGSLGLVFAGAAVEATRSGSTSGAIGSGAFAALHLTLATNGARGLLDHRDEFDPPNELAVWALGSAYGINTLYWASQLGDRRSRAFGVAEVAVNSPIMIGLGYLAYDRIDRQRSGPGLLYGGMAALSGAYVVHGLKTAIAPRKPQKLDLLGTDVMPTVVSDGLEVAPGLGATGSF